MNVEIKNIGGVYIAEIISEDILINSAQNALDIMMTCAYDGAENIIFYKKNIIEDFFDLRTGLAGDILQKFSTYNLRLAIVGDFSNYTSKALKDFIFESNKGRRINFVSSLEEAEKSLSIK